MYYLNDSMVNMNSFTLNNQVYYTDNIVQLLGLFNCHSNTYPHRYLLFILISVIFSDGGKEIMVVKDINGHP